MNLVLTGFEPFDGSPINPSGQIAKALSGQTISGFTVCSCTLPVDSIRSPAALLSALRAYNPVAVICLGEAAGRPLVSIERVAINLQDYRIPDNTGNRIEDQPIVPGGPAAFFSTLPAREILIALRAAGIPAELSLSAGAYLCNQVFYSLMYTLSTQSLALPAGFIHLPSLPAQIPLRDRPSPSMALETSLQAVRIAIQTTASMISGLLAK